ncbi:MAG: hypothetical protein E7587_03815 [Ruminococcaceae bacterium]|nr:hypothetical protein [Oscillospiraceae bacterium]
MKTTNFSRMMSLVLVFAMLATMFVFNAGAAATFDESGENLLTYVIEGDTVTILKCSDKATGEVVIPAEIDGKAVTKIDKNAFEGCKSITSLVIPEGVTVIGGETVVPELTIDDYADLFVKSGLIFHLNFADAETGAVPGSDKYEDETALAAERFVTPNTFWNNYIVDAVSNGDYFKGGAATVEKGGWKFLSPYRYAYWYNADDSLAHTAGSTNTFDNFVTEPGLTDEETGDLLYPYYVVNGEYKTTESAREIGGVKKPLYTLIHTAPESATGYYISAGVWGKTIYSDAMGDGYLANGKGGAFYYSGSNLAAVQTSKEYTVNLTVKSADSNVSAYKLYYGGRSGMRFDHAAGTVTFVPENNDGALHNTASALVNRKMNGIKTNGVIAYTFTVDAKNIANNEATLGFYINGRSDFDGAEATQTITTPVKTIPGTSEYHISGSKVQTYAIRVYDKVLTEQEVLQNNFADIATIAELDITYFLKLTEEGKQKVYEAFEGKQADDGKATLQLILDVATGAYVEAVEYDYYDLFVSDGLLYHMNFASATEDIVIDPESPDAELAHLKYAAAADTYDSFVVGVKEGITNKIWAGGTATISEGGWKFLTPFVYDYWFDADGNFKTARTSPASTFAHFVTEEGLEDVPYYMNGDSYVKAEAARTIGGETKPLYQLVHTAPEGTTGYYIPQGIWANPTYSSAFGNGYFDAAKGNDIKLYNAVSSILAAAKEFSVELVAASTQNSKAAFFIGPRFEFTPTATSVKFVGSEGNEMLASDSGYSTVTMTLNGQKINTYAVTFDLYDDSDAENIIDIATNNLYNLTMYGNGTSYGTQTVKSKVNKFQASNQFLMRGDGLYTYAMRVYEKELSANEVLRNRFADIVTIKALELDIGRFLALNESDKLTVYNAFNQYTPDDDKKTLQATLDGVLATVTYGKLFAEDGTENAELQNNFAEIVSRNKLEMDIDAFIALSDEEKLEAYKRFENYTVDTDRATLQSELDIVNGKKGIFDGCEALTRVTLLSTSVPALPYKAFYGVSVEKIIVRDALIEDYKASENWSDYADIICGLEENCTHPQKETVGAKEPTCGAEGYTGDIYCTVCHSKVDDGSPIEPTGEHIYDKETVSDEYLKSGASCTSSAVYYKSCKCGASSEGSEGETTFDYNGTLPHTYDRELPEAKFLKSEPDCTEKAIYYKSCVCGMSSQGTEFEDTFEYGEAKGHNFDRQVTTYIYRKSFATADSAALYYYSCACGAIGEETFEFGDKLPESDATAILFTSDQAKAGETLTVDIMLQNNPGISFVSITLNYDKNVFILESVENASASDMDEGLNIQWSSDTDNSDDGVWATLTFRVKEDAEVNEYILNAAFNEAYNKHLQDIIFEVSSGIMSVSDDYIEKTVEQALIFDGYQVRTQSFPGLRSLYTINKSLVSEIEMITGKKVIVGAIMASAGEGRDCHADLTLPLSDGNYDGGVFVDHRYVANGKAYQEVYNGTEEESIVGSLISDSKTHMQFAFTTVFDKASTQTAEMYTKDLIYRGYAVVKGGNSDGSDLIFYADMTASLFDKNENGEAITLYELSEYIHNNLEDFALTEETDTMIDLVLDAVNATSAPQE